LTWQRSLLEYQTDTGQFELVPWWSPFNDDDQPYGNFLGQTGDGLKVYDRPISHLTAPLRPLIAWLLAQIKLYADSDFISREIKCERNIGHHHCLPVTPEDKIVYAIRENRRGFSRFVLGHEGAMSPVATLILKKIPNVSELVLMTGFIGEAAPAEMWEKNADDAVSEFWQTHALAWGTEPLDSHFPIIPAAQFPAAWLVTPLAEIATLTPSSLPK
jgi:hypothetical protein